MKIEFITHHALEDSTSSFLVIAKSMISHRKSKWMKFVDLLHGYKLQIVKVMRYSTPIHEYKDTPLNDEIHQNIFTVDMNGAGASMPAVPPAKTDPPSKADSPPKTAKVIKTATPAKTDTPAPKCPIASLFTGELALSRILPSDSKRGALHKAIVTVFGREWSRGNCVDLRVYWLLEVHRRILRLEQALSAAGVDTEPLAPQRAQAFSARKYVLIDPLTLGVPMLLGHLRGAFDVQVDASFRLLAVTASVHPLLRYGLDLTAVARERLADGIQPAVQECLFDWPFAFLPDRMRATLGANPFVNAETNIERRIEKEQVFFRAPRRPPPADAARPQDDVEELRRTQAVPRKSPLLKTYARLLQRAPALLAADTHAKCLTRHLPPTPSLQDAVYDPAAFLAQLEPSS